MANTRGDLAKWSLVSFAMFCALGVCTLAAVTETPRPPRTTTGCTIVFNWTVTATTVILSASDVLTVCVNSVISQAYLEVHSQQRPVLMSSDETGEFTAVLHSSIWCENTAYCRMVIKHPGGEDARPIVIYLRPNYESDSGFIPGGKQRNSSLFVHSQESKDYIAFYSSNARVADFSVQKAIVSSPSLDEMVEVFDKIEFSEYTERYTVHLLDSESGLFGFAYEPVPYHGTVYQVVHRLTSSMSSAYTPLAVYPCKLDSTAPASSRCAGVLPIYTGEGSGQEIIVKARMDQLQELVFNFPPLATTGKHVGMSAGVGEATADGGGGGIASSKSTNAANGRVPWTHALLQAHTQHTPLIFGVVTTVFSRFVTGSIVGSAMGSIVDLTTSSEQVVLLLEHVEHFPLGSHQVDQPVYLTSVPYSPGIVPGKCGANSTFQVSSDEPERSSSVVRTQVENPDTLVASVSPAGLTGPQNCSEAAQLTYEFYFMKVATGSTLEQFMAAIDSMRTVESIRQHGTELIPQTPPGASARPYAQLQRMDVDTGYVINVIASSAAFTPVESVPYIPASHFNCYASVSEQLQNTFPCKQQLSVNSSTKLELDDGQIATMLVEGVSADSFVVVQSHAQVHRLVATLNLSMALDMQTSGPLLAPGSNDAATNHRKRRAGDIGGGKLSYLLGRSTGMVVKPSGSFDYFLKTYSYIGAEVLNLAVPYPTTAPIPGGCCPDCAASVYDASQQLNSLANPIVNLTSDNTNTTVTFFASAFFVPPYSGAIQCAAAVATFTYELYKLSISGTSAASMFDALEKMSTVESIQQYGSLVVNLTGIDKTVFMAQESVQPGKGIVYAVIAVLHAGEEIRGRAAYVPAVTYGCSYVSGATTVENRLPGCETVLEPNQVYKVPIGPTGVVPFMLNDWQSSASHWTFAVINVYSQRVPVQASLKYPPTIDTTSVNTNIGFAPILNPNGGNEQTAVYITRKIAPSGGGISPTSTTISGPSDENVTVMIQAVPYGPSIPIPGGCCLTCSLDVDPTLKITYSGFRTDVDFYEANVGYTVAHGVPNDCDSSQGSVDVAALIYTVYKRQLDWGKFDQDTMFNGLQLMSTVDGVKKHGKKIGSAGFVFHNNHRRSFLSRPGLGVIYNILVQKADDTTLEAVYSPFVTYSCDFATDSCSHLHSLPVQIGLGVVAVLGLFMCIFGHRYYKAELVIVGGILPLIAAFALLNSYTSLSVTWLVVCSMVIALVLGFGLFLLWSLWDFPHFFHMIVGFNSGLLTSAILFFTPFGDIGLWHLSPVNYWSAYFVVVLLVPVITLIKPLHLNIFATCLLGAFLFIMGVAEFVASSLSMIVVNVVLHAVDAGISTSIYSGYVLSTTDIILLVVFGFLVIFCYIMQLRLHRKSNRLDFPTSPAATRAARRRQARREPPRTREIEFPDSPPLSPTSTPVRRQRQGGRYRNMQPIGANDAGWGVNTRQRQSRAGASTRRGHGQRGGEREPLLAHPHQNDQPPPYGAVGPDNTSAGPLGGGPMTVQATPPTGSPPSYSINMPGGAHQIPDITSTSTFQPLPSEAPTTASQRLPSNVPPIVLE